jgi:hypothetical protein
VVLQCRPLPGCSSNSYCPAGDGCNYCTCYGDNWGCTDIACEVDGGGGGCPLYPPPDGSYCAPNGLQCNASFVGYCPPVCTCLNGSWSCSYPPCPPPPPPPPACPPTPPSEYSQCYVAGQYCAYPAPYCGGTACQCQYPGTWVCNTVVGCPDGG